MRWPAQGLRGASSRGREPVAGSRDAGAGKRGNAEKWGAGSGEYPAGKGPAPDGGVEGNTFRKKARPRMER